MFDRLYRCRMKGKILGIRSFEVGVIVRGEFPRQENDNGRIVYSNVVYDKEF